VASLRPNSAPSSPIKMAAEALLAETNSTTSGKRPRMAVASDGGGNDSPTNVVPAKRAKADVSQSPDTAKKPRRKYTPMDEVMRLHQDEGVLHLLHALPTSRRKDKVNYFPKPAAQAISPTAPLASNGPMPSAQVSFFFLMCHLPSRSVAVSDVRFMYYVVKGSSN
jgi:hypothetical protein